MPERDMDALTAREREVLALIGHGLTNEEIAERLGITLDGAKYHVSQILSKLGVATREEAADAAAAARAAERRRWWAALPLAAKAAGAALVVAAVAGVGLLAWGAVVTSGDGEQQEPSLPVRQIDPASLQPTSAEREVIETGSPSIPRVTLERSPFGSFWYSPDGLSFATSNEDGIVIGRVDGSDAHVIELNRIGFAWMPDSQSLVVSVSEQEYLETESDLVSLELVAADGSWQRQIGSTNWGRSIQVLPDGRIGYVSGEELHLYDSRSSVDTATGVQIRTREDFNDFPFKVSPDGTWVAVRTLNDLALRAIEITTGDEILVESATLPFSSYAWSPDSTTLIYSPGTHCRDAMWMSYDVTTKEKDVLIASNEGGCFVSPSWTPDGRWMIYSLDPGGTQYFYQQYFALDVQTGENVKLFEDGGGLGLSPDGERFVLRRESPGKMGMWLATLEFASPP